MKDITIDIFIKCLIEDFNKYQKEWLTSHNDVEFDSFIEAFQKYIKAEGENEQRERSGEE